MRDVNDSLNFDQREANVYVAKNDNNIIRARFAEERAEEMHGVLTEARKALGCDVSHRSVVDAINALLAHVKALKKDVAELEENVAAYKALVDALMGVPVPVDADRVKRMEDALRDFAEHGTRHDTCPTHYRFENLEQAERYWLGWVKSMDDGVRRRASEWLDGASPAEPVVAMASVPGADEAGGEGPAAGPTKVDHLDAAESAMDQGNQGAAIRFIIAHLRART